MSKQGTFEYKDRDIVCLAGERGDRRTGWINIVAVHSLRVELSSMGDLIVTAYPRENQQEATASLEVFFEQAKSRGGKDPDEG